MKSRKNFFRPTLLSTIEDVSDYSTQNVFCDYPTLYPRTFLLTSLLSTPEGFIIAILISSPERFCDFLTLNPRTFWDFPNL